MEIELEERETLQKKLDAEVEEKDKLQRRLETELLGKDKQHKQLLNALEEERAVHKRDMEALITNINSNVGSDGGDSNGLTEVHNAVNYYYMSGIKYLHYLVDRLST